MTQFQKDLRKAIKQVELMRRHAMVSLPYVNSTKWKSKGEEVDSLSFTLGVLYMHKE